MKIFIIGPGGVGKSTSGEILAKLLDSPFIDLDAEFCARIENIGMYIQKHGYEQYCFTNSELFYQIVSQSVENFVCVLSSGFLVHEGLDELIAKHKRTLQESGVSILLLPSKSLATSMDIVIKRQLARGFGLIESKERTKFTERYEKYQELGEIKIFSCDSPEAIAEEMRQKLFFIKNSKQI